MPFLQDHPLTLDDAAEAVADASPVHDVHGPRQIGVREGLLERRKGVDGHRLVADDCKIKVRVAAHDSRSTAPEGPDRGPGHMPAKDAAHDCPVLTCDSDFGGQYM